MKHRFCLAIFVFCCVSLISVAMFGCSQMQGGAVSGSGSKGVVVLDIGHFMGAGGAQMPAAINGKRISECAFWYQYAYDVKREVERGGYACVVTNRGKAPTSEPLLSYARRAGVVQLNKPDVNAARYPSRFHPDRVASGMISADYAVHRKAACVVFLHHNSSSHGWVAGASPSLIIHNRYNGGNLARCLARTMEREVLNQPNGLPNAGRGISTQARYVDADRAAGWMNTCDDSGIPAAVIEVAYLNNKNHATALVNDECARRYARAVGKGIVNYMQQHGREARHYRANPNKADEGSFGYAAESRRLTVPGAKILTR